MSGSESDQFLSAFQTVLDQCFQKQSGDNALPAASRINASKRLVSSIQGSNLHRLIELHQLVSEHRLRVAAPSSGSLGSNLEQVCQLLREPGSVVLSDCVQELLHLLTRDHMTALSCAHDDVANGHYLPVLPAIPTEVDEDEGMAMKIVRLVRNNEPLGATIKCQDGNVVIARVMKGGVADRSGCIQVGDTVVEVNGQLVAGMAPAEIVQLLTENDKTVTFKLIPADDMSLSTNPSNGEVCMRVRALFPYNAPGDTVHPCPEAGLSFKCGDILELLDCHDQHWWQARHEGVNGENSKVGLIPSRALLEKKAASTIDSRRHSPRTRKIMYETGYCDELEHGEVRTYEDVAVLYPRGGLLRPVVLVGPPGVGRNELKRRLLMINPDRYGTTVPHTSREARDGEMDGVDYHFVTKHQMEEWVRTGEFIEYGEYRGNIYGTLADSVRAVLEQGRVPVLSPHPQALKLLRTPEIKPYIVYVKPPAFPALKETRSNSQVRSTFDPNYSRGFTDEELEMMHRNAKHLEALYGHYFDYELVNGNLEFAFRELCDLLQKIDSEPQWVPSTWVR